MRHLLTALLLVIAASQSYAQTREQMEKHFQLMREQMLLMREMQDARRGGPPKGPHVELGISTGVAMSYNTQDIPSNAGKPGTHPAFMITTDLYHDRHKSPFSFAFGTRFGVGTGIGIGIASGVKYDKAISESAKIRVGIVTGPWVEYANGYYFGLQPNIVSELSIGTLISNRLYVGLKYFQPYLKYQSYSSSYSYQHYYDYNQTSLLCDIKVRFGRP